MEDERPRVTSQPANDVPICRVGVDLTSISDVEASLASHGKRYLGRLFTEHEVASCQGPQGPRPDSLAARFAAKEAVLKVLRPTGSRPEWRDIEVRSQDNGACDIVLHGAAAVLAEAQRVEQISVSLSHEAGMAVAVVVACCRRAAATGSTEVF